MSKLGKRAIGRTQFRYGVHCHRNPLLRGIGITVTVNYDDGVTGSARDLSPAEHTHGKVQSQNSIVHQAEPPSCVIRAQYY
jgi:hypothetical protein